MIQSELLQEKQRVQTLLSQESASIQEYLLHAHLAAEEIAKSYGFHLQYAEILHKQIEPCKERDKSKRTISS